MEVGTGNGECHFPPGGCAGVWYTEKAGPFTLIYIGRSWQIVVSQSKIFEVITDIYIFSHTEKCQIDL